MQPNAAPYVPTPMLESMGMWGCLFMDIAHRTFRACTCCVQSFVGDVPFSSLPWWFWLCWWVYFHACKLGPPLASCKCPFVPVGAWFVLFDFIWGPCLFSSVCWVWMASICLSSIQVLSSSAALGENLWRTSFTAVIYPSFGGYKKDNSKAWAPS